MDLDDTLSIADKSIDDSITRYSNAKPIEATVNKLREYHQAGWYIIIYTARHMVSSLNDVDKAFAKHGQLTADWLERHNVPFDQLIFGKPYGIYYVDDKAMTIDSFLNSKV